MPMMPGLSPTETRWTDSAFRARMLADGTGVAWELGLQIPGHHRHRVVLENARTFTTSSYVPCALAQHIQSSVPHPVGIKISITAPA
jgi:hypothetical protein